MIGNSMNKSMVVNLKQQTKVENILETVSLQKLKKDKT